MHGAYLPGFVQLPLTATWQDMKDLFREAGNVVRADVSVYPNGAPKGTGIVVYESHADANNAVGESLCIKTP